ncbi:MAG: TspO/MBR family protein [Nanoarchaeota archaeon]
MKKINWKILISSLLIVYLIAFLGSLFTSSSVNSSWYQEIKPEITPPNLVFPVVWNILFFLIALSLYFSWINAKTKKDKKRIILVYCANLILNLYWSILYFGLHNPILAFYEIILFWFSIIAMILITYKINKTASYLLVPYLLWVSFAIILNYMSAF